MARDYNIAAIEKAVKVENFLVAGEILEWKTAAEVAAATGLTKNEAFRILFTLEKCGRVVKSEKGYRVNSIGLISVAVYAQEYVTSQAGKLGFRRL